jgi:hypothetical protein
MLTESVTTQKKISWAWESLFWKELAFIFMKSQPKALGKVQWQQATSHQQKKDKKQIKKGVFLINF